MDITLPDVSQSFQKTKVFLTEKVEKAVNSTSQATAQAKSSLSETADKAKEALTQTTNSAVFRRSVGYCRQVIEFSCDRATRDRNLLLVDGQNLSLLV